MTKAPVLKPFTTRASRYKPGDFVTAADFAGHSFDLAHAQEQGLVGELEAESDPQPEGAADTPIAGGAPRKNGKK